MSVALEGRAHELISACSDSPEPWTQYSNAQRWLFLSVLFLITVSNYFDFFVMSVVLDPIKREFHLTDTQLGLLSGPAFACLYALAAIPLARWADRGNRRTVLTVCLAGWSLMTLLCGMAQRFGHLVFARLGVGAMEPGAVPPAQSLLIDYFPPDKRATAISLLTQGGSAAGWLAGATVGGFIAARAGWRMSFTVAGGAGLVLAVLARVLLQEPRLRTGMRKSATAESIRFSIRRLLGKSSFLYAVIGLSIYTTFSFGVSTFIPSFMMRSLNATLEQISLTWGVFIAIANLLGAFVGGRLGDELGRRDRRWYLWLPVIACLVAMPIYWGALAMKTLPSFVAVDFAAEMVIAAGLPTAFVAIHQVCGSARRAMATAVVFFAINLFGTGLGPLVAGTLSDLLMDAYNVQSLRHSLAAMILCLLPAAASFYIASRTVLAENEP